LANYIYILSPQRIVMGGGVMQQPQLFPLVRQSLQELLGGYLRTPVILERMDQFVVPPGLDQKSGVLGALALAQQATGTGIRKA
jgi:fructokinase